MDKKLKSNQACEKASENWLPPPPERYFLAILEKEVIWKAKEFPKSLPSSFLSHLSIITFPYFA
ncbi:putative uncharacterized protein [Parachlamydia acanthamoebae UV-7]|uniref:Uncharacterized protein n=1 Tax=Parachlamydia acanthamoebae (strain UV7) TaxID=765952 RepID=F8L2B1_PARAV|nr:putative uncharacterized protein [Parachlamydia acanthamoebae UV-7]